MSEQWLQCEIDKGMFSDEVVVIVSRNGDPISFFAPKEVVQGEPGSRGHVKVQVFERSGTRWAVLPNDSRFVIPVRDEDLLAA